MQHMKMKNSKYKQKKYVVKQQVNGKTKGILGEGGTVKRLGCFRNTCLPSKT